jgi:hypothetical protein
METGEAAALCISATQKNYVTKMMNDSEQKEGVRHSGIILPIESHGLKEGSWVRS